MSAKIRAFIFAFILGFTLCGALGYFLIYRSSARAIADYRREQYRLESIIDRERGYNNREREVLESNDGAIQKLRNLLLIIKEREQASMVDNRSD